MLLVLGSSVVQYFQIKQTMPTDKEARKLKQILKEAGEGKTADQGEVNAALSRNMSYIFPVMIFFLTVSFAAALSLYWFVGGVIAYLQQDYLLKKDKEILALDAQHDEAARLAKAQEAEIIKDYPKNKKPKAKKVAAKQKKRR
jgi:membrane protein insertase Oxa1/YidC/SpoIIIJ